MIQQILEQRSQDVKTYYHRHLGFFREFHVLEMKSGCFYIQTNKLDEYENIETIEFYFASSKNTEHIVLLERERTGVDHDEMKSYPDDFEIYSKIKCLL